MLATTRVELVVNIVIKALQMVFLTSTVININVLKSAGAVVGFLADHLWAFALVVGGILYTSVMEISKKNKKIRSKNKKVK